MKSEYFFYRIAVGKNAKQSWKKTVLHVAILKRDSRGKWIWEPALRQLTDLLASNYPLYEITFVPEKFIQDGLAQSLESIP